MSPEKNMILYNKEQFESNYAKDIIYNISTYT